MTLDPLRQTDPDDFDFDWIDFLVPRWEPGTIYYSGQVVRPRIPNGFFAECVTSGNQSSAVEPNWVRRGGAVVFDGSVEWVMRAPSDESLATIDSVTYTITPSGIAQGAESTIGMVTRVRLDAAAAPVGTYTIVAEMTDSDGEDHTQETTLPVIA